MLASPRALWERLTALGMKGEIAPGERRRIRLTNQSAVIGVVSCSAFALAYAIAGPRFRAPLAANLVCLTLLVVALVLNARGARTLAKIAVLFPVNLGVVVSSMMLGGRVGFLYYFFLFAAVSFLLFSEEERVLRYIFALLSTGCCIFSRVVAPQNDEIAGLITPLVAQMIDVASSIAVIATVVFIVHLFTNDTSRAERRLAEEHARSERLLLNILPGVISTRLKASDGAIADGFADVTVLFADIVGFTELSQTLSPDELVKILNRIFSAFDDLAEHFGIEKIKTIGDCYMVAAGLPELRVDHVEVVARMALQMRDALERINREDGLTLRIRIGLHPGPVVAGVIGKRKFIYDLWGDTVNTASRMESSGTAQEIQVTRHVHDRLKEKFELLPRGTIQIKGKGQMETFWLKSETAPLD